MNPNIPNEEDVYASMLAANPDLQKQNQMASKQLNEERSPGSQGIKVEKSISSNTIAADESLTDKIKNLEKKLKLQTPAPATNRLGHDMYKDEFGQNTWYVKNESGMHISLGDELGVVIKKGEVMDLLGKVSEDILIKSKNFMSRMRSSSGGLRRLTPEEYFNELQLLDEQTTKIRALEASKYINTKDGSAQPQPIRPLIESQLNKLDLYYDTNPENSEKGMDPLNFIRWIMAEKFNVQEIDSMLGHPRVRAITDITSTLVRKRHDSI